MMQAKATGTWTIFELGDASIVLSDKLFLRVANVNLFLAGSGDTASTLKGHWLVRASSN
jgi:hypothetical protein